MFLTTAAASVYFDKLPDAAVTEIAKLYKLTGTRTEMVDKLRDMMHHMTYAELDPIFAALKKTAIKHGVPDAVKLGP